MSFFASIDVCTYLYIYIYIYTHTHNDFIFWAFHLLLNMLGSLVWDTHLVGVFFFSFSFLNKAPHAQEILLKEEKENT